MWEGRAGAGRSGKKNFHGERGVTGEGVGKKRVRMRRGGGASSLAVRGEGGEHSSLGKEEKKDKRVSRDGKVEPPRRGPAKYT